MYQAILFYTYIDERPEIDYVTHGALQEHPSLQIFHLQHIVTQDWFRESITRIKSRFLQILQNIIESGKTDAYFFSDIGPCGRLGAIRRIGRTLATGTTKAILQFNELAKLRYPLCRL